MRREFDSRYPHREMVGRFSRASMGREFDVPRSEPSLRGSTTGVLASNL